MPSSHGSVNIKSDGALRHATLRRLSGGESAAPPLQQRVQPGGRIREAGRREGDGSGN